VVDACVSGKALLRRLDDASEAARELAATTFLAILKVCFLFLLTWTSGASKSGACLHWTLKCSGCHCVLSHPQGVSLTMSEREQ